LISVDQIKQEAQGRWIGTLSSLGLSIRQDGKHGPCPLCGGKDRFRLDKDGSGYICNQCGAGDSIKLVQSYFGIDFRGALKKISEIIGMVDIDKIHKRSNAAVRENLIKLWESSAPITESDLVCNYLRSRKINITSKSLPILSENLRFCPKCYESDTTKEMPALIARILHNSGKTLSVHRTYLDPEGGKAKIGSQKKIMPAVGSLNGSAIRLLPPRNGLIGVAEGIETALACSQLHRIPTWSVINSTLMESFNPPEGIKKIVIFGDNDKSFTGQKAAYVLANRLYEKYVIEVVLPDLPGDWANELERYKK